MILRYRVKRTERGVFSRPVHVIEGAIRQLFVHQSKMARGNKLTASEELTNGYKVFQALIHHQVEKCSGEKQSRDTVFAQDAAKLIERTGARRHHNQTATVQ